MPHSPCYFLLIILEMGGGGGGVDGKMRVIDFAPVWDHEVILLLKDLF